MNPGRLRWFAGVAAVLAVLVAAPNTAVAAPRVVEPRTWSVRQALQRPLSADTPSPTDTPIDDAGLDRMLAQDLADYDEDPNVRAAAKAALDTNDPAQIRDFLDNGLPVYRQAAADRAKQAAADNRAKVQQWAQSGGSVVKQKATAALATNNDAKIADFVAVGYAAAKAADDQDVVNAAAQAKLIQSRVVDIVAHGGYEVKSAGQAALDSEDPAVIAEFYNTGYQAASTRDTQAQQQIDAALAARTKALDDLTATATKATQAADARTKIIAASVSGTQSLTIASNSLGLINKDSKQADAIYTADLPVRKSGGATHTAQISALRLEACTEYSAAARNADQVTAQAGVAGTAADTLVATGLSHGIEWSKVLGAQSDAAVATKQAAETACRAAEATEAAAKTLDADHNATVDANNAVKYRQAAEREQAIAEKLADHAEAMAAAAQAAAADAHAQRLRAEKDANDAQQRAVNARSDYQKAAAQRDIARSQMGVAIAQQQAALAAARRAVTQQNKSVEAGQHAQDTTRNAIDIGKNYEGLATQAQGLIGKAQKAAKDSDEAAIRAANAEAAAIAAAGTTDETRLKADADIAKADAGKVKAASDQAHREAVSAAGAAGSAKSAATAAAQAAAAARADAAAAAHEAQIAHQDAVDAANAANKAINDAQKANADARTAVNDARAAIAHAAAGRADAELTMVFAQAAVFQSGIASFQSRVADRAALDARVAAAGIANPAASAIDVASAYADTDSDAAMALDIASNALLIGDDRSASAQKHADDAQAAADHAAAEALKAGEQVKPAYVAAQKAAEAANRAVKASKVAIDASNAAAKDANATVVFAQQAYAADRVATYYSKRAQAMAIEAGHDAAVARQASNNAQGYALKAKNADDSAASILKKVNALSTYVDNLSKSVTDNVGQLTHLADTLQGVVKQIDDAEAKAKQKGWDQYLKDHTDKWLQDLPILSGAIDEVINLASGMYTLFNCSTDGDTSEACKAVAEGMKAIYNDPGLLIHTDVWKENWQKAMGMTLVDIATLALPGVGEEAGAADGAADGVAAGTAKGVARDLAAGSAIWGSAGIQRALASLGAIDTAKIIETMAAAPGKLTFSAEEVGAMVKAITVRGIETVEQTLKDLGESPALQKLKDLVAGCLTGNSFAAGTRVLLADGTSEPIQRVRVGDRVLATDPTTGVTSARRVTALHRNTDDRLTDVSLNGHRSIRSTPGHPFWDVTRGQWAGASDLRAGDRLRTPWSVSVVRVRHVHTFAGHQEMYNLTVAGVHTFYVLAGDRPVLVHNDECDVPLFRGTDPDWPGGQQAQASGMLPTSTDPGVATIFALHFQTFMAGAEAVVQIALPEALEGLEKYAGYGLKSAEAEVFVEVGAEEFGSRASLTITVSTARQILKDMGIELPTRIKQADLDFYLNEVPKLTDAQIAEFLRRAAGHGVK
ncbi:Hint domain-containing protein [Krasilnikovia sp. MM14-A1259]|uniref:Hint domain-containing protein n=1 Tax=Krasilnikovia sp. MM14-A1259 TaxID=3373539 RepID=UPI0038061C4B